MKLCHKIALRIGCVITGLALGAAFRLRSRGSRWCPALTNRGRTTTNCRTDPRPSTPPCSVAPGAGGP